MGQPATSCEPCCSQRPTIGIAIGNSCYTTWLRGCTCWWEISRQAWHGLPWMERNMILLLEWLGRRRPLETFESLLGRTLVSRVVVHALFRMGRCPSALRWTLTLGVNSFQVADPLFPCRMHRTWPCRLQREPLRSLAQTMKLPTTMIQSLEIFSFEAFAKRKISFARAMRWDRIPPTHDEVM